MLAKVQKDGKKKREGKRGGNDVVFVCACVCVRRANSESKRN